jgi:hypothetical protein
MSQAQRSHDGLDSTVIDRIRWATDDGASGAFVACLATESPTDRHLVREKFDQHGEDVPAYCGHFLTALWEGRIESAWSRADSGNAALMMNAGVPRR